MAIIKKGITYDGTPVNTLTYGGTQVKEVWYGTDKLVYFYGKGTPGLSYTKVGNLLEVTGKGSSEDSSIVIPTETYEYLDGNTIYSVRVIGENAFLNNTKLKTMNLGNCSYIYPNAFKECSSLVLVAFPKKSDGTYYTWLVTKDVSYTIDPGASGFNGVKLLTDTYVDWTWVREG